MQIETFREILFLPLDFAAESPTKDFFAKVEAALASNKNWQSVSFAERDARAHAISRYGEFNYFHRFIQQVLYSTVEGRKDPADALRVYRRTDIVGLTAQIWNGDSNELDKIALTVDRVHLFVFSLAVGLLLIEVSSAQSLSLKTVQRLLDTLRRVYPPYFVEQGESAPAPRRVVEKFEWKRADGNQPSKAYDLAARRSEALKQFQSASDGSPAKRQPALDAHWEDLLSPLQYAGLGPATASGKAGDRQSSGCAVRFQLFGDDRAPAMAYLAAANPRLISEGDWQRIAFFDDPGSELGHPYSPGFLEDFVRRYYYDRFWHPVEDGVHGWLSTRYTLCGYGFAVVGSAANDEFVNEISGIQSHFRYHYAVMGLLVHLQHAALLSLSNRLAKAVEDFDLDNPKKRETFHRKVEQIHLDFLRFTHRFWFEDITGQVQGQDLYRLWREQLKLPQLYQEIMMESQAVNDFLDAQVQEIQAKEQGLLARVALLLALIGFAGLLAGLALTSFQVEGYYDHGLKFLYGKFPFWKSPVLHAIVLVTLVPTLLFLVFLITCYHWPASWKQIGKWLQRAGSSNNQ